jgi:hypothetical protein
MAPGGLGLSAEVMAHGGIEGRVAENPRHGEVGAGVRLDRDLGDRMPEQVRFISRPARSRRALPMPSDRAVFDRGRPLGPGNRHGPAAPGIRGRNSAMRSRQVATSSWKESGKAVSGSARGSFFVGVLSLCCGQPAHCAWRGSTSRWYCGQFLWDP